MNRTQLKSVRAAAWQVATVMSRDSPSSPPDLALTTNATAGRCRQGLPLSAVQGDYDGRIKGDLSL